MRNEGSGVPTPLEGWISGKMGSKGPFLTRRAIEAFQLKKLRETVRWAREKSRFYREHLRGLTERDLLQIGDLRRLPFTTPQDLRRDPLGFLCVSQGEISRVVTLETSGTSGPPKRVFFTERDQELTIDFFRWGMSTFVQPGERVLVLLPGDRPGSVGDLLMKALRRLGAFSHVHGPVRDPAETLLVMEKDRFDAMVGIPVQVLGLARTGPGKCFPRSVLLSTDHVPASIERALEKTWGCEVFHHYGMTEMGFGGGVECNAHTGYHFREADLYMEIVDSRTGEPVPDGTHGEVVFTTLTREGMPFIRYRTGDLSAFATSPCPCGTCLKTMEHITQRVLGRMSLAGGGFLTMAHLDEVLFGIQEVLDFTATLSKGDTGEVLAIGLVVNRDEGATTSSVARDMLACLPVVRSALERKELTLQVKVAPGKTGGRGSPKRCIVDMRNGKVSGDEHL